MKLSMSHIKRSESLLHSRPETKQKNCLHLITFLIDPSNDCSCLFTIKNFFISHINEDNEFKGY